MILTSAVQEYGIDKLWKLLNEYQETMIEHNEFYEKRQSQLKLWFWSHLKDNLFEILFSDPEIKQKLAHLESKVTGGEMTPGQASDILVNRSNILIKQ